MDNQNDDFQTAVFQNSTSLKDSASVIAHYPSQNIEIK